MTIDEFYYQEYDNLTKKAKQEKLKKIFDYITEDPDTHLGIIDEIMNTLIVFESDDYFGTEGFKLQKKYLEINFQRQFSIKNIDMMVVKLGVISPEL